MEAHILTDQDHNIQNFGFLADIVTGTVILQPVNGKLTCPLFPQSTSYMRLKLKRCSTQMFLGAVAAAVFEYKEALIMNDKIKIDLGFAVLTAEQNPDPAFSKEIIVGLESKQGQYLQDIAVIGQDYAIDSNLDVVLKDNMRVLVYGNENSEDYTDAYLVGLSEAVKEQSYED